MVVFRSGINHTENLVHFLRPHNPMPRNLIPSVENRKTVILKHLLLLCRVIDFSL